MLYSLTNLNTVNGLVGSYASTYGSDSYNSATYNGASSTGTGTGTTPTATASTGATTSGAAATQGTPGALADTGFNILVIVSLASLIIFAALVVRFVRRAPRKVVQSDSPS